MNHDIRWTNDPWYVRLWKWIRRGCKKQPIGYFCCRFEYYVNPDGHSGNTVFLHRTKGNKDYGD